MNEKNKNFDKDVPDEVFERIAAEKRRKLEEFLKGLEQQESPHKNPDNTMTIHSDVFAAERKKKEDIPADGFTRRIPSEPDQVLSSSAESSGQDAAQEDDDVKIFGTPAAPAKPAASDEEDSGVLSLFEQEHIIEEEVTQAKQLAMEKQQKGEAASDSEEDIAQKPTTQEILKQARSEKIKTFTLDENLDLEKQEQTAEENEEGEDEEAYEYLPGSDPQKIREDFTGWKNRRVLQIWVSAVCFVLMLFIVIAPALPLRLLPYTLAASSGASSQTASVAEQSQPESLPESQTTMLPLSARTAENTLGSVGGMLTQSLPGAASETVSTAASADQTASETASAPAQQPAATQSDNGLNPKPQQVRVLLIVLIGISLIVAIFCFDTLRDGAVDFFCMTSSYQSAAFVVYLVCLLQAVWLTVDPASTNFVAGVMGVFMPAGALAVLAAEIATYLRLRRDSNNFEVVSGGPAKHLRVQNIGDSNALERPRGEADCATAVFIPADFSSDYFAMADCEDGCDRAERIYVPAVMLAGLLLGFAAFLLNGKAPAYFITVFAAFVCAAMPVSLGIASVIGQLRTSKAGKQLGFAVSNQFAYEDATEMTSVVVDDTQIFSAKSMVLHGIKTFNDKRMDEAIIIAASASQKRGGPLRELFSGILSENEAYLLEVDNETVYQPEKGMVCWISGKRVVMGTREFVGGYDIDLPDTEYENKYGKNGRSLVYLALGNEMMAIFVISYRVIPEIAALLRAVSACGVCVLVNTNDPCLTSKMLCRALKLPAGSVLALNAQGKDVYERVTAPTGSLKSGVVCNGGTTSELMAVVDSFRLHRSQSIGMGLQYALTAIAVAVLSLMVLLGDVASLSFPVILLIQAAAAGLLCLLQALFSYRPRTRKNK